MSEAKDDTLIVNPRIGTLAHLLGDQYNIEATNTILERVGGPIISVDALTDEGWFRGIAFECGEEVRERFIEAVSLRWREPKTPSLVFPRTTPILGEDAHAWIESAEAILTRLEDTAASQDEMNETVLFAETTAFSPEQISRLLDSLGQFISENRCSAKEKTILSLGAAIRKFAMNMPENRFDEYASWLSPEATTYPDHRVELDLVQGISWRLTYVPVEITNVPNQLIETLQEIANEYTSPRFIVQKTYAATAVEATVALVLLTVLTGSTGDAERLLETACKVEWFSELVIDQLQETAGHSAGHDQPLSHAISQVLAVVA